MKTIVVSNQQSFYMPCWVLMTFKGRIKNQSLIMLMDFGSTYNFIDQGVVKRMNGMTKHVKGMKVTVANGKSLRLTEVCRNLT